MRRLPLFPLPVVLLPGALMPLHVFEPRYRQMMAHCLEGDRRFGVIYHDPDRHGPYGMEPGGVGCVAEILRFQPLPDGRSLVVSRGLERFRVEDGIESDAMYYEALVEGYQDRGGEQAGMAARRRRTIDLYHRVLDEVIELPRPFPEIDEAAEAAFPLAQTIRIDPTWQQELLMQRTERDRLELVDGLLNAVLRAGRAGADGQIELGPLDAGPEGPLG